MGITIEVWIGFELDVQYELKFLVEFLISNDFNQLINEKFSIINLK